MTFLSQRWGVLVSFVEILFGSFFGVRVYSDCRVRHYCGWDLNAEMLGFWRVGDRLRFAPDVLRRPSRCSECAKGGRKVESIFLHRKCLYFQACCSSFPLLLFNLVDHIFQPTQCQPHWDSGKTFMVESTIVTKRPQVVVSMILYFHPYLGRWCNFSNIFFRWVETTN